MIHTCIWQSCYMDITTIKPYISRCTDGSPDDRAIVLDNIRSAKQLLQLDAASGRKPEICFGLFS